MASSAVAVVVGGGKLAVGPAAIRGSVARGVSTDGCSLRRSGLGRPLRQQFKRETIELKRPKTVVAAEADGQGEVAEAADDLLKKIQEAWDKVDDKLAVGGLGFAALLVLWGSTGLISAIDKLPILPGLFELVGILVTGWFTYKYLIFKPDREELLKIIDDTKAKILED